MIRLCLVAFTATSDFETSIKDRGAKWSPPGALHGTFTSGEDNFEIWKTNLAAPGVRQLINRIEVLVPLFIEGGSYIARDLGADDTWAEPEDLARWAVFLLYRKQAVDEEVSRSPYLFAGYSTVYQFFPFQAPTPPSSPRTDWDLPQGDFDLSELPCRSRLSQFIILPPYQGKGVGAQLYKSIFELYLQRPQTVELTIEDPNEAFDDMRDLSDLTYLRTVPEFSQVQVDTTIALPSDATSPVPRDIINPQLLETLKRKTKIAPRQFARLVEMHTMSQLPASVQPQLGVEKVPAASKSDKHKYHLWQVWVKKRVYKQNRDILGQIESGERLDKLNEALRSVELEYARLLAAHARWVKHYPTRSDSNNGKRKLADEAEDQNASKKPRVEEA